MSLDIEPATIMPGVVAVLTADDIAGENGLGDYSQEEPVLCPVGATVRMVGAPVALVVAETPAAAKAGLAAIEVGYEILPHVFETDEALGARRDPHRRPRGQRADQLRGAARRPGRRVRSFRRHR